MTGTVWAFQNTLSFLFGLTTILCDKRQQCKWLSAKWHSWSIHRSLGRGIFSSDNTLLVNILSEGHLFCFYIAANIILLQTDEYWHFFTAEQTRDTKICQIPKCSQVCHIHGSHTITSLFPCLIASFNGILFYHFSLTIFIEDNQSGSDVTKIHKIALYGTT